MDGREDNLDPGWTDATLILVPLIGPVLQQRRFMGGRTDGLTMLRSLYLSFCSAFVLIGIVVAILDNLANFNRDTTGVSVIAVALAVIVVGLSSMVATLLIPTRLATNDPAQLAGSYRTRFFVRLALAEAPALGGFAAFLLTGRWWMYVIGLVFTAVGLLRLAPTQRHIQRDQHNIAASAVSLNLTAALRSLRGNPRR